MSKKMIALFLTFALIMGVTQPVLADYYSKLYPVVKTVEPDFTDKTVIIHSNDVHGAIEGYAFIPALREALLALGATDVLTADVGDFSQGEIYVSVNKGQEAIEMMNAAGYDVVTLGNHEFDFGYEQLMSNLKKADFQTICANVFLDETGESILPPSTIIETKSGLKIGFVGIETPETATKVNPGLISQISFSTFGSLYETAQKAVDEIRGDCDLVIAMTHLGVDNESALNGYRSVDMLNSVDGIDFVLDAHSHTVMTEAKYGLPVQSTGTKFAYIGLVVIDNKTKSVEDHFLLSTAGLKKDETVEAAAKEIIDAVDEEYNTAIATSEVFLNGEREPGNRTEETNLGDLITDAMVWEVTTGGGIDDSELSKVVAIINGGGIRASIEAGDVTMKDINNVLPFGNTVAVIYASGKDLLEALEASTFSAPAAVGGFPQTSGIEWTLDTTVPYDQGEIYKLDGKESSYYAPASIKRVTITSINDEPFDPEGIYAVITSNFIAAGGDTYNAFNRAYNAGTGFDTGIPLDEAVIDYVVNALDGTITSDVYGQPRGSLTLISETADSAPEETEKPAA